MSRSINRPVTVAPNEMRNAPFGTLLIMVSVALEVAGCQTSPPKLKYPDPSAPRVWINASAGKGSPDEAVAPASTDRDACAR